MDPTNYFVQVGSKYGALVNQGEVAVDIAVVGLGQAGGHLAAEFYQRGYPAIALNTARSDLNGLNEQGVFPALPEERRLFVGMEGSDGAGSDPSFGAASLEQNRDAIRDAVRQTTEKASLVVVCAGLGGGTGSAVKTLLEMLNDAPPVIALLTLPSDNESSLTKLNAMRAVQEVVQLDCAGWLLFDNGRLASTHQNVALIDFFSHINSEIVAPLDAFNRINAGDLHPIRAFDGEDLRKLLCSGGMLRYATVEQERLEPSETVERIREAIQDGDLMPGGANLQKLTHLGVVIEASEQALEQTSVLAFEAISSQLKEQTQGAAILQGIYRSHADEQRAPVTIRVLGSMPDLPARVYELLEDARNEGEALKKKMDRRIHQLDLGEMLNLSNEGQTHSPRPRPRPSIKPSRAEPEPVRTTPKAILTPELPKLDTTTPPRERPRPRGKPPRMVQNVEPIDFPKRRPRRKLDEEDLSSPLRRHSSFSGLARGSRAQRALEARRQNEPAPEEPAEPVRVAAEAPVEKAPEPVETVPEPVAVPEPLEAAIPEEAALDEETPPPADFESEYAPDESEAFVPEMPFREESITAAPLLTPKADPNEDDQTAMMESVERPLSDPNAFSSGSLGYSAPPMPLESLPTGNLPDPVVYEEMVDQFKKEPSHQMEIAERLYADANSEMTLVRFYAVEAMVKLKEDQFLPALEKASQDKDNSVRDIAKSALLNFRRQ